MQDGRTDWEHLLIPGSAGPRKGVASADPEGSVLEQTVWGAPRARLLSLGAGVQSTALLLLAAEGRIPCFDAAIFADTGWEPREVYEHLARLEAEVAAPAGIPIHRVSFGDLRADSLSDDYTTVLPLYITNADGGAGMLSRQCTQNYKLIPIYRTVRGLLGAAKRSRPCDKCAGSGRRVPPPSVGQPSSQLGECSVCRGTGDRTTVGAVSDPNAWVSMSIGFSTDEIIRVAPSRRRYVVHEYPLLDLGWSRDDARAYLAGRGFAETPRSACIGCPYHSNAEWTRLARHAPEEWADVIEFDAAIRKVPGATGIQGEAYLHRDRVPLPLSIRSTSPEPELPGCSPFGCRTMAGVDARLEDVIMENDERGVS